MEIFLGKTRGRAILFVFDLLHVCLFVAALSRFGYCQAPFPPSKIQRPISGTQTGLTGSLRTQTYFRLSLVSGGDKRQPEIGLRSQASLTGDCCFV